MSDQGRDRATQLVVEEVSVDFTKHTVLSSAHEHRTAQKRELKSSLTSTVTQSIVR